MGFKLSNLRRHKDRAACDVGPLVAPSGWRFVRLLMSPTRSRVTG